MNRFNDRVVAQFRAGDGHVEGWGDALVLIHHRGARTGTPHVNPAMSLRDGDDWLVVASAMGARDDPAWAVDLRALPEVRIEAVVDGSVATVPVLATELAGAEREAAFARFVAVAPAFAAYQAKAGRLLPVIRFRRRWAWAEAMAPDDPARQIAVRRPDTDPGLRTSTPGAPPDPDRLRQAVALEPQYQIETLL
jgi:deazaflavin-dependent oxidoreductase (nitroreductase family)